MKAAKTKGRNTFMFGRVLSVRLYDPQYNDTGTRFRCGADWHPSLETEMQSELHLAHRGRCGNLSCPSDIDGRVGIRKVHVIQRVIVLPLELQSFSFRDRKDLP